jgi:hypothetical protein
MSFTFQHGRFVDGRCLRYIGNSAVARGVSHKRAALHCGNSGAMPSGRVALEYGLRRTPATFRLVSRRNIVAAGA